MGSLGLAGAIGGIGAGMLENVERENTNEQKDLDRMHMERLQELRDTNVMDRQTNQQEFTTETNKTAREFLVEDRGEEREYEAGLVGATQVREDFVREDEQEQERYIEAMKQFTSLTKSGSVTSKDNKWEMQIITDTIIGPNGLPIEQDRLVVREPGTPGSFVQHDLIMVPDGISEEKITKALALFETQELRAPMDDLLNRIGTNRDNSSEFLEHYGFLPFRYFRELRTKTLSGVGSFERYYSRFRQPANRPQTNAAPAGNVLTEATTAAHDAGSCPR